MADTAQIVKFAACGAFQEAEKSKVHAIYFCKAVLITLTAITP